MLVHSSMESQDISVSIETKLRAGGPGSVPGRSQTGSSAHTASCPIGTGGSYSGVKRAGREANHSRPSIAGFKNVWSYIIAPPIRLSGVVLG